MDKLSKDQKEKEKYLNITIHNNIESNVKVFIRVSK